MRLLLSLLTMIFVSSAYAQDRIDESIIDDGRTLLANLKSVQSYRKFVSNYKKLPTQENTEKMIAVGIIGARIFKLEKEFTYFAKYLQKNYPDSVFLETVHTKNLSDECQACEGEGVAAKKCLKCKGNGACTNHSCSDGQVSGYDRVDGRFVVVQRQCIICKGGAKCQGCEGSGEAMGTCTKCRKKGYIYSAAKAIETYEGLVQELVDGANKTNEEAKRQELIAKGMVEIDGEFYSKEQVAKMEQDALEARRKADEAERRAMELAEAKRKEQQAAGILTRVDSMIQADPDDAITKLKTFIAEYPDHDKVGDVKKELQYADLYKQALGLEEKGAINKAIRKYQEVLKFKNTQEILLKIKKLDEQTIGL